MTRIDEQLERRINEHLDGRLDADAEAQLYRRLLRDPQARALMDEYAANDRDASLALRAVVMAPSRPVDVSEWTRRRWRFPWAQALATAALVLVAVGVWQVIDHLPTGDGSTGVVATATSSGDEQANSQAGAAASAQPTERDDVSAAEHVFAAIPEVSGEPWWRRRPEATEDGKLSDVQRPAALVQGAQQVRRQTDRALLGVIDDQADRVYWMRIDHQQTHIHAVGREL